MIWTMSFTEGVGRGRGETQHIRFIPTVKGNDLRSTMFGCLCHPSKSCSCCPSYLWQLGSATFKQVSSSFPMKFAPLSCHLFKQWQIVQNTTSLSCHKGWGWMSWHCTPQQYSNQSFQPFLPTLELGRDGELPGQFPCTSAASAIQWVKEVEGQT